MSKVYDTIHAQSIGAESKSLAETVLSAVSRAMKAYMTARSRSRELERLHAKSDDQLAAMGLRREDIPRYVFRDMMYL